MRSIRVGAAIGFIPTTAHVVAVLRISSRRLFCQPRVGLFNDCPTTLWQETEGVDSTPTLTPYMLRFFAAALRKKWVLRYVVFDVDYLQLHLSQFIKTVLN